MKNFSDGLIELKDDAFDFIVDKVSSSKNRKIEVDIDLVYLNDKITTLEYDSAGVFAGFKANEPINVYHLGSEQIIQIASFLNNDDTY